MESNPLYRLYIQLKERVDVLSMQGNVTNGSGNSSMDVSDLVLRLRNLENRPTMENDLKELAASVANLKAENSELKSKLEVLNKFENIEGRLYTLEVEPKVVIEPLVNRLNVLEANDYDKRLTALESRLSSVEQFNNQIPDLTYRIGEIEKRPDLTQRLNALESFVSSSKN